MENKSNGGFEVQLRARSGAGERVVSNSVNAKQVLNILLMIPGVFLGLMALSVYPPLNRRPLMCAMDRQDIGRGRRR